MEHVLLTHPIVVLYTDGEHNGIWAKSGVDFEQGGR